MLSGTAGSKLSCSGLSRLRDRPTSCAVLKQVGCSVNLQGTGSDREGSREAYSHCKGCLLLGQILLRIDWLLQDIPGGRRGGHRLY